MGPHHQRERSRGAAGGIDHRFHPQRRGRGHDQEPRGRARSTGHQRYRRAPGATRTERTTDAALAYAAGNTIGRIVEADEVADVVAFLASPRSAAITGDAIACGGGTRGAIHY
jgi:hypothetical protein